MKNFISKLDKINFTVIDGKKLSSSDGWEVRIETELNGTDFMPVQLIARVLFNKQFASRWGASSEAENKELAHWFLVKVQKIYTAEFDRKDLQQKQAKAEFDAIGKKFVMLDL